jgi:hypothetical protein
LILFYFRYDSTPQDGAGGPSSRRLQREAGFRKDKMLKKRESSTLIRRVIETVTEKTAAAAESAKISLNLKIEGHDLSVAMFADVIKDAQWIQLTLTSYEMSLAVSTVGSPPEIDREVSVKVGTAVICRMVEHPANAAKNWVRPSNRDSILEFPASSLLMHTRQAVSGPKRKGFTFVFFF